mgnify:CR=1 FL=1
MSWLEACKPIIERFEVAAAFNQNAVHNAEGSRAVGKLMRAMAARLDYVNEHYQPKPGHTPWRDDGLT